MRRSARERTLDGETEHDASEFDEHGHWRELPERWIEPDGALEQKQFLHALERCLASLPPRTVQAFLLREHIGMATEEICNELGVTPTHCWVLLYRARMALRECLQRTWFAK